MVEILWQMCMSIAVQASKHSVFDFKCVEQQRLHEEIDEVI